MDSCYYRMYTQWVESIALKWASGAAIASFIQDNVLCRCGILKRVLSNNGTPFVNSCVRHYARSVGSIMLGGIPTIFRRMAKSRPPTKLYYVFLVG